MRAGHIDWAVVRRSLEESERRQAASALDDESRREALLRKRAQRLGARAKLRGVADHSATVMTFLLRQERYALPLTALSQVLPVRGLVPVVGAPEKILGVMSLLGEVGTIWDLARLLGLRGPAGASLGHVLVLKSRIEIGLAVDYVEGTREIEAGPIVDEGDLGLRFMHGFTAEKIHLLDAQALSDGLGAELDALGGDHLR